MIPAATQPLPNLTIPQLRYLLAVADHPTWADAAQALGVSGSALSQGISELQRRLGLTLFDRNGRNMVIRPEAATVIEHARLVVTETRDLAKWADELRAGKRGRVAIGMIDAAAITWFGDTVAAFRSTYPSVDLHLVVAPTGELIDELRAGRLDLIVAALAPHDDFDDLQRVPLVEEPLYVLAPAGQETRKPADWGPWVTFPERSHTRRIIERSLRAAGATFDVIATSSQPQVLREMVRIGSGWTVLPDSGAATRAGFEGVARVRAAPIAMRTLMLFQRANRQAGTAELQLRSALLATAAGAAGRAAKTPPR